MHSFKKSNYVHVVFAVIISILIFSIASLLLSTKINEVFNSIFFPTELGNSLNLIDPTLVNSAILSFADIFFILNYWSPNFWISNGIEVYTGEITLGISIFIFVSVIAFFFSGFYLGKKNTGNLKMGYLILPFSILFTLVLLICSFIYENKLISNQAIIEVVFTHKIWLTLLLSITFSMVGFLASEGKRREQKDNFYLLTALKSVTYTFTLYFMIVSAFIVLLFGTIKERLIYMFPTISITELFNRSVELILTIGSQATSYLIGLSHLVPVNINILENETLKNASYSTYNGISLNGEVSIGTYSLFIIRDLLNKIPYDEYLVYLILIPIIVIIITGYKLKTTEFKWKIIFSYSFFYTIFIMLIVNTSTLSLKSNDLILNSTYEIGVKFYSIQLIMLSFIIAFIGLTIGNLLSIWKKK